jgi:hypothetical protein
VIALPHFRPAFAGSGLDADALAYIAAVEAADGQSLESATRLAINSFVKGCKTDGIWDAIKASCILAGARTLSGALVPLRGTAPTNFNFVSGDYNRKTGLVGNGSTKYLDSNRNSNTDPQNSFSISTYVTQAATAGITIGAGGGGNTGSSSIGGITGSTRNRSITIDTNNLSGFTGLGGTSRSSSSGYIRRFNNSNSTITRTSETSYNGNFAIFCTLASGSPNTVSNARISFYHIGESLDLAALDSRVSTLMTSINSAIP